MWQLSASLITLRLVAQAPLGGWLSPPAAACTSSGVSASHWTRRGSGETHARAAQLCVYTARALHAHCMWTQARGPRLLAAGRLCAPRDVGGLPGGGSAAGSNLRLPGQRQRQSWTPGARGALVAQVTRRAPAQSLGRLGPHCSPGASPRRLPKMPTPPPFEHLGGAGAGVPLHDPCHTPALGRIVP